MGNKTREMVERIVDLPTLPQVVTTLINLLNNPRSSVKDISTVMGNDPALVAKLLKIVNSSFYSLPNRVSNVPQAITILGYNTIKALAISASVFDLFAGDNPDFPHPAYWVHSLGTGTIARQLSKALPRPVAGQGPRPNPDTAFVSGLLHGIGKLILDQYAPDEFTRVLARARDTQSTYREAELAVAQESYAEVGYWLMRRWQMPEDIQDSVRFHIAPESAPEAYRGLSAAVLLGAYFCRRHGYGSAGDFGSAIEVSESTMGIFGLQADDLEALMPTTLEELQKADVFFSLLQAEA